MNPKSMIYKRVEDVLGLVLHSTKMDVSNQSSLTQYGSSTGERILIVELSEGGPGWFLLSGLSYTPNLTVYILKRLFKIWDFVILRLVIRPSLEQSRSVSRVTGVTREMVLYCKCERNRLFGRVEYAQNDKPIQSLNALCAMNCGLIN